jgi:adenylosuccinate synthase
MDVVIGAAFGDEGKGLMTHYLASRYGRDAIVVRFNGGAQAGHTVVTTSSQRHVFRHVGSGTFAGATTFLSHHFVSNPILFLEELKELHQLGLKPNVYIDPSSYITTPYDMMINQIVEECRANQRHGSCGVGFAETIERNLHPTYSLTVADLENSQKLMRTLQLIRNEWLPQRLNTLNISNVPEEWNNFIESDDIFQFFLHQLSLFLDSITVSRIDLSKSNRPIIFEGAQGLMLDQVRGWFPHVTRSHTGIKNVLDLIKDTINPKLNVIYVTRCYLTRHGAGPLPHELSMLPYKQVHDKTNITNSYQGALRYAWFNLPMLKSFVLTDRNDIPSSIPINYQLAVTCFDQVDDHITFIDNDKIYNASHSSFLQKVATELDVTEILCSYSPTIDTLKIWSEP